MNKQPTQPLSVEAIKNQIAKINGFESWSRVLLYYNQDRIAQIMVETMENNAMQEYAQQSVRTVRQELSEENDKETERLSAEVALEMVIEERDALKKKLQPTPIEELQSDLEFEKKENRRLREELEGQVNQTKYWEDLANDRTMMLNNMDEENGSIKKAMLQLKGMWNEGRPSTASTTSIEPVSAETDRIENELVEDILSEFKKIGIDTSEWEYKFGDGNNAHEFIAAGVQCHIENLERPSTTSTTPIEGEGMRNLLVNLKSSLIEHLLSGDTDKPFMVTSNRGWTKRQMAAEVQNETEQGIKTMSAIIKLAIDLVARGKRSLNESPQSSKDNAASDNAISEQEDEEAREEMYQLLNNGGYGLTPSNAHKLQLDLCRIFSIKQKQQ